MMMYRLLQKECMFYRKETKNDRAPRIAPRIQLQSLKNRMKKSLSNGVKNDVNILHVDKK